MRIAMSALVVAGLLALDLNAGTIRYTISELGPGTPGFRYTYTLNGFELHKNQELDIRFDPAIFGSLFNGQAGAGFDLILLQPNNPVGAFGDYSALALVENPSLAGPFSVDFTLSGTGPPAAQPYFINQYDDAGTFVGTIASGRTVGAVPEPATLALGVVGLLSVGVWWAVRRRSRGTA